MTGFGQAGECEVCRQSTEGRWLLYCARVDDDERRPDHRVCVRCYCREASQTRTAEGWVATFVAVPVAEATAPAKQKARAPRDAGPKKRRKKTMAEKLLER